MAKVIVMPKLGYTQDEGSIAEWFKKEGDTVTKGEPFYDVHTDKSVVTVEASYSGTVLKIVLEPEVTVPVLTPIAVIGKPGEDADAALASHKTMQAADAAVEASFDDDQKETEAPKEEVSAAPADLKITPRAMKYMQEQGLTAADVADVKGTGFDGGITERDLKKASPLAKKTAQKLGVDLNQVEGSGVGGKVMKADVEAAAAAPKAPAAPADGRKILKTVPYKGVRKIIGDRLAESKFTAPHLYFTDSIDMTNFTAFRKELNAKNDVKIAASDLFVKAASKALTKYPAINSSLVDGQIIQYESTNVGMAVAGDNGLIVPVVKDAQAKTLTQIAGETRDLVERAKAGRLKQEEYNGGTFSISNLGMFGIENFTAIINPPEAAILSISSIRMKPVAVQNADGEYEMAIRPMMNVQLSVDHRIIDGLDASQFVKYFKELIEEPIKILI